MRATVSAKIRINPNKEIVATIKAYTKALQFCVDYAWKHKIIQNFKLHYAIYRTIRKRFKLPSQITVACMRQACGMVKKAKTKPIIKRTSVRYNFPRSANIKGNILVLRLLKVRQEFKFTIPDCYKEYFTWKVKESILRMDKKGRCFFIFTFSKEVTATEKNSCTQTTVLGIDLGVNNLAVTSDSRFYNSTKVKQIKRKFKCFYQLQSFIEYKAGIRGIKTIRVKPHYTSQICHRCGHLGSRSKGCFSCSHCALSNFNADLNASRNLAHPMLVERQGAVTHPYSQSDEVKSISQDALATELMVKSPIL